jgi:myosin heavy subunit
MAVSFDEGSWVWMPDEIENSLPARVLATFKPGQPGKVRTEDGEDQTLTAEVTKDLKHANPEVLDSKIDNLISLNDLNEEAILHNLRIRFKQDIIYTNVSSICVSVNPFKMLPLYTPEVMDKYREDPLSQPPHVFKVAEAAYKSMMSYRSDQSIIISGESGAGKSEATKVMLQFLADLSSRAGGKKLDSEGDSLEQQILQANPVMEAFGNAKTVRNNNSSRFGKLITVKFDNSGAICGGSIVNYLLEKSRVVFQALGERNYHVFYQIIAGCKADAELKAKLGTKDPQDYKMLDQSGVVEVDGINDETDFEVVKRGFRTLQMGELYSEDVQGMLLSVVACLTLGNITFKTVSKATEEDSAAVQNMEVVEEACAIIGIDAAELSKNLTTHAVSAGGDKISVGLDVEKAQVAKHALVKSIYGNLFQWVIDHINSALAAGATAENHANIMGVLDIFGFESFVTGNSFEQLCINYCNEKLQFHFNDFVFKVEQSLYKAEGVNVPETAFQDNQPTIDLLELKLTGVFPMIDEEINVPKGSDTGLLNKLRQKHKGHPNFKDRAPAKLKVPNQRECFGIVHYAGAVYYDVTNFLEKNKDELPMDIKLLVSKAKNRFMGKLFPIDPEEASSSGRGGKKKGKSKTLGFQFKASLTSLMDTLNATEPSFVRCMKPNAEKIGDTFTSDMMLTQLRYSGLLEVCRIRKLGFPVRCEKQDFVNRYRPLGTGSSDLKGLLKQLVDSNKLEASQYAEGKTKVFLKNAASIKLDVLREEAFTVQCIKMQARIRTMIFKFKYQHWVQTMHELTAAIEKRDQDLLHHWMDMFSELPHGGRHLPIYRQATALMLRLGEESQVLSLIATAMEGRVKESLKSAIKSAAAMNPPFSHPKLKDAQELVTRIESEESITTALRAAMAEHSKAKLEKALKDASNLGMNTQEVKQATTFLDRILKEESAIATLRQAVSSKDVEALSDAITKAGELGLDTPEVKTAKTLLAEIEGQVRAKKALTEAMSARNLQMIKAAITKAKSVGVPTGEVAEAQTLVAKIEKEEEATSDLQKAISNPTPNVAEIDKALAAAKKLGIKSNIVGEAEAVKESLQDAQRCTKALTAAAKSGKVDALSAALTDASRLGLKGPEVEAAKKALDKATSSAKGTAALAKAAAGDDVEAIEAAMKAAEQSGQSGSSEYKMAADRLTVLLQEAKMVESLTKATIDGNRGELTALIKKLEALGVINKYPEEVKAAREKVSALSASDTVAEQIEFAMKQRDADGLNTALARAADLNMNDNEIYLKGAMAQDQIAREAEVDAELGEALEAPVDPNKLGAVFAKAKRLQMMTDNFKMAEAIVERDRLKEECYSKLKSAKKLRKMALLQEGLELAIQLGLKDEQITAAQALRNELQPMEDEIAKVIGESVVLQQKIKGKAGIKANDLPPLQNAIAGAKASRKIPDELWMAGTEMANDDLVNAEKFFEKGKQQLKVQSNLAAAKKAGSYEKLKAAIDEADDLELDLQMLSELRETLRDLEVKVTRAKETLEPDASLDIDAAHARNKKRQEQAKSSKYSFKNFSNMRTPDDFARSQILNKKKLKEGMFKWTNNKIPKSLTVLKDSDNRLAVQLHKSLLGYMGDLQMSFPATLAQDILEKGLKHISLRDEIYVQLMKQLSTNPAADSIAKGWQVMCMCVSTFPPSGQFELYLLNFLLVQREKKGAVRNYARYCLRSLEGLLESGASGFVPTVEEIGSYKERPPILATVELVDGSCLSEDLPVTPDLNVGKVVEICVHFLELTDKRASTFGIFVYDLGTITSNDPDSEKLYADLKRTPRPLRNEDFMGDIIVQKARQKRNFKFVFKRKIFLAKDNSHSSDDMFNKLTYLQAEDEVIKVGNLKPKKEADMVKMAALSYTAAFGEDVYDNANDMAHDEKDPITDFISPLYRSKKSPIQWAEAVLPLLSGLASKDQSDLHAEFIEATWANELYGAQFFNVHVLTCGMSKNKLNLAPTLEKKVFSRGMWKLEDVKVAFNQKGLWIFTMDYINIAHFGYADIYRWGGSSSMFSLIVWNPNDEKTFELKLSTAQAADMAGIILDYINAIMAATPS